MVPTVQRGLVGEEEVIIRASAPGNEGFYSGKDLVIFLAFVKIVKGEI